MRYFILSFAFLIFCFNGFAQDETETVNLIFIGDVMGHTPQIKSAYSATTKTYDYKPTLKYVKPIVEKADLAIGNLEVTLPGKPPYKGYPQFRSPDALAEALRWAGFDMMVTANNHSNDAGLLGLTNTIDVLQRNGFYHTGTFKNKAERDATYPLIVYKKGIKIAFINCTYGTNGLPDKAPTIVNRIDEDELKRDLETAKAMNPDVIIALIHWGLEYKLVESPEQRKIAKKVFEWGADVIIGAHPHVIQPIKTGTVKREDGTIENTLVTYSLGNFISNQKQKNTDGGLMFELDLVKNKRTGKVTVENHHYIPVWRYLDKTTSPNKKYGTYYALPMSAFEDNLTALKMPVADQAKFKSFAKRMRAHLSKYNSSERKFSLAELGIDAQGNVIDDNKTYIVEIGVFMSKPMHMPFKDIDIKEDGRFKRYNTKPIKGRAAANKELRKIKQAGFINAKVKVVE